MELACAGMVYLRVTDSNNSVHIMLVMTKNNVATVKCVTIPILELCGAVLLARVLYCASKEDSRGSYEENPCMDR